MIYLRLCLVSLFYLTAICSVNGQPAAAQLNLDEVLERYYAANGGLENIRSVQSLTASGTMKDSDGTVTSVTLIKKRPNLRLLIRKGEDGTVLVHGYDGNQGWNKMTMPDGTERLRLISVSSTMSFDPPLIDPEGNGAELELLPIERDGRNFYYGIRANLSDGSAQTYWLDARTFREVRSEFHWKDEAGVEQTRLDRFEEVEKISDIWFSRKTVTEINDGESVTNLDTIRLNAGVFNDIFAVPEALK